MLRVATLAELSAAPGMPASSTNKPGPRSNAAGNGNGQNNNNAQRGGQYRGGAPGGRGQTPAGVANALREGSRERGFEQTDLTGEGTNAQTSESNGGAANEAPQAEAALQGGANSNATSDSFLLQGTACESSGGSGPGSFGQEGLIPGTPGDQGVRGGRGGGGGHVRPGSGWWCSRRWCRRWRRPGRIRRRWRSRRWRWRRNVRRRAGRLGRQTVNRIRFSFYDRYENSAFDARPILSAGNEAPKPSHYDERSAATWAAR